MDALAVNHLRNRLARAEREFRASANAAQTAMEQAERHPTAWANVASHAVMAAQAAAQVEVCHDALVAAGERP